MNKSQQLWKKLGIRNVEHLILCRPEVPQTLIAQAKQNSAHITDFSETRYIEVGKDLQS